MVLTRRAGLAGVAALVAVLLAGLAGLPAGWVALALTALLVALVAVDVVLAGSPRRVRAVRGGETSVRLGEPARTTLLLTNTGRRPVRGWVRDAWIPSAGAVDGVKRLDLPVRQRRLLTTTLHPTRRGDRHAGPVVVRCLGPLRLAGRQAAQPAPWTVRVLPPFTSRKHLPGRLARLRELDGRSVVLQRGQGTEFDSLREYVPGDDVRSIDWRGTARSATVVVRTWRPERDRHVLVVLDSGRTSAGRVGDQPRLDHLMDAALLLAALAARAGDRVDLLVVDRTVRASVARVSAADVLPAFVQAMADVEPLLAETDHRLLVTEVLTRTSQRSLVVLLTGLDRVALAEGLVPQLGLVLRKHTVVVGAVSDPAVDVLAAGREDAAAVYAAAAAEVDRSARAETARTLRQRGVQVVEAPPDRIAPDLADHYLALKKTGRL
ncbi:uncharacterized protein (DUF58 family) [Friedmanniella endophytica]|uniref:Uncharacterized protein (DUF58 family) n=1 Tax=Microlunatus kandeliicorticis TaxID=1759536 RepID=A0A7W3IV43_9ACTN|nr:DUF58 domain-containing protein [Microlunatus kandeliicorticis]MBA8795740.1 uncharacterized protein (DUF58 family) [Microlunatus kandeliicorticis]